MPISRGTRWAIVIIGILLLIGLLVTLLFFALIRGGETEEITGYGDKVAIVEVKGTILSSENVVRQLKKFAKQPTVRALVLRIDSPGGSAAASQEIYEEVKRVRNSGKPVVASMGSMAASGGYYISVAATKIVANPATVTGSIGVISQFINVADLLKKVGIQETTVKTGKFKDAGSPFRSLTEEEKLYFQELMINVYDQFVDAVASERNLPIDTVRKYGDGRLFSGAQAKRIGLVDTLGSLEDAIRLAGKLGGIRGEPATVRELKRVSFVERLFDSAKQSVLGNRLEEPLLEYKFAAPQ
ncbi:MAG: signal peptide peptidase SppA [Bacteroidota bacterium]